MMKNNCLKQKKERTEKGNLVNNCHNSNKTRAKIKKLLSDSRAYIITLHSHTNAKNTLAQGNPSKKQKVINLIRFVRPGKMEIRKHTW